MSSQNVQEEGMEKEVPEVPEEEKTPEEVEAPKKGKVSFSWIITSLGRRKKGSGISKKKEKEQSLLKKVF